MVENVPAAQLAHVVAPAVLNVPAEHGEQTTDVEVVAEVDG